MLENFRIALRKQRRLIVLFLVTVFLPALSLGIFGIRAIRNERFREARRNENDHRRIAQQLRSYVSAELRELGLLLANLADSPAFRAGDRKAIAEAVGARLAARSLVETVFYWYGNKTPCFPSFDHEPDPYQESHPIVAGEEVRRILDRARDCEFKTEDFRQAITLYRRAGSRTKEKGLEARALFAEARCLVKLERYQSAVAIFERVAGQYPESVSDSGLPLAPAALLQTVECRRALADAPGALKTALDLYEGIIEMRWPLTEDRFHAYAGLTEEATERILKGTSAIPQMDRLVGLRTALREKEAQWAVIDAIRQEIVPDLRRRQTAAGPAAPLRYSKTIGGRPFLILASEIHGAGSESPAGLLGVKLREDSLRAGILSEAAADESVEVVISDLDGKLGMHGRSTGEATITELFDDNFPPWRMQFYRGAKAVNGAGDLRSSFFFWTILTLVVVLTFGTVLIVRTIAREMEVLKLKSDFVSSVSHEFKTPLTSIKALTERLQGDKSIEAARMRRYFSLISQSADQLSRLVKNLLDFSRIEEGKLEYRFAPADIGALVGGTIADFERGGGRKESRISARISEDVPPLSVDRDALSQALTNLLDNAFKFSPADAEVGVRVARDGERVVVEVADYGIGIPPDEQERIFDKFYQGKHAAGRSAKGTGLGLTLARHAAEAHGGRISVRSRVGQGSTFTLTLPIREK